MNVESLIATFAIVSLPSSFAVWASSPEARFLSGKFVWAHWDVDELKAIDNKAQGSSLFTMHLEGFPDVPLEI